MNILVTGASGFIGRRLASRLKFRGHQVESLALDITKPFALNASFDLVVHLAAYNITNVGTKDEERYSAVNVEGTKHVLEGVKCKRFIYLSTTKVYKNEGHELRENSPLGPQGAYAQSKLKAEEVCNALAKKESLVILRSVNVLGWGQAPKAVLPVFYQKAKDNQPLDIISAPHTPMQFVYAEDLIDAIEAVIAHPKAKGIFNIAHPETINLEQLAKKIIAVTHSSSKLHVAKNASEALFSLVTCSKAERELGWKPKASIKRILELYDGEYARSLS